MNEFNEPVGTKQISTTVSEQLAAQIQYMATRDNRSVSSMAAILLQQAVKERLRQNKKNAKKD